MFNINIYVKIGANNIKICYEYLLSNNFQIQCRIKYILVIVISRKKPKSNIIG